jgi:patatin-related protein
VASTAKELRLGLVCYGGSSLAIYMHGVTKEVNKLLTASAARATGGAAGSATERVYTELLDAMADSGPDGTDLRVLVDVIAGTSAGGINGIFLGKAVARNRSQDSLRDIWFNRGDMSQLVIGPRKVAGITLSWKVKVPFLLRRAVKRSPLRGDDMSRWLHAALLQMESTPGAGPPSLLPPGHPLDLYVTITDFYGYQRMIPLARPRFATDARHRHALHFHYESNGDDDFTDDAGLAFAARTTSCFPAVFPPVNPASFAATVGDSVEPLLERCFRSYRLSGADPNKTYFVDGGVLDNKPFGWAIDAIINDRPADSEVDRRLLYLEPDPGKRATSQGGEDPETLAAAIGALTTIPRAEPILDDLLGVAEHNDRVGRIQDVVEANFGRVAALIDPLIPASLVGDEAPADWPWADWNSAIHALALRDVGLGYGTYLRLKISSVLDGIARSVCAVCGYPEDSNHAALVRDVVHHWARTADLYAGIQRGSNGEPCADQPGTAATATAPFKPSDAQVRFLQAFDLGFMRRRLRFLIAAFNWWYRCVGTSGFPSRGQLDEGKGILYQHVAALDALAQLRSADGGSAEQNGQVEKLRQVVRDSFPETRLARFLDEHGLDGGTYVKSNGSDLDALFAQTQAFLAGQLDGSSAALLSKLVPIGANWSVRCRRDLVIRYLGFPIWDVLLYPIQALTQIGEGDAIKIVRVSPREATILPTPQGGKVEGSRVHHFYAFFSREVRENDYLWGRLDAAEQLIRLLLDSAGSTEPVNEWCKRAFLAVIDEEQASLVTIRQKVEALRDTVVAL